MGKFSKIAPDAVQSWPQPQAEAGDASGAYVPSPSEAAAQESAGQKAPPKSDVPARVGLIGLAGLVCWVLVCRNWPAIADALGIGGPRLLLSGPYASLVALLASAIPMAVWSLVVEKVHLSPTTGIDWAHPRPLADILDISVTKLTGLWATWALIGSFYCLERWYWHGSWVFAMEVLGWAAVAMCALSIPYVLWLDRVLVEPRDGAWHFGALLIGREACDSAEVARHLRIWAVKGYFTAFMVSILPGGFHDVVSFGWQGALHNPTAMGGFMISIFYLIDVQIGTVGYLLTLKPLDSHIRSANPFLAGWVAALICYPGFFLIGDGGPVDYHPNTADWQYWLAGSPVLGWVWLGLVTVLTGLYAWATMAFGIRFSNLTYRGVVTNGPYRITRHPAYLFKNTFWWVSTLPFLTTTHSWVDMIRDCTMLAGVNCVYYWRAKTEERHLCAEDAKYRAYCAWMLAHAPITSSLSRLARWAAGGRLRLVQNPGPGPEVARPAE